MEKVNNAIFIQSKFDTEEKFKDQKVVINDLHNECYIEKHKIKNNLDIFGTISIKDVRKIIKNNFINLKRNEGISNVKI